MLGAQQILIPPIYPSFHQPLLVCLLFSPTPNALNLVYMVSSLVLWFSYSVMSDSLWPHGLQHARLPFPSPSPGVCSNSCSLSWWCHSTISSSIVPFSSCLQSSASRSFPVSQLFTSGGQSIGVSASASVLPMNIQGWFPSGWTDLISLFYSNTMNNS